MSVEQESDQIINKAIGLNCFDSEFLYNVRAASTALDELRATFEGTNYFNHLLELLDILDHLEAKSSELDAPDAPENDEEE